MTLDIYYTLTEGIQRSTDLGIKGTRPISQAAGFPRMSDHKGRGRKCRRANVVDHGRGSGSDSGRPPS